MNNWSGLLVKSLEKTRDIPESRYFQLATIDHNGLPQNRTVVCRGFDDSRGIMWVDTDARNQKVAELFANPNAAACWYFAKTREQYRLAVTAHIATPDQHSALCESHWQRLSMAARQQFLWGEPGAARHNIRRSLIDHTADTSVMPAHFCVLTLTINAVDYLNLRGNPQNRQRFVRAGDDWQGSDLIP